MQTESDNMIRRPDGQNLSLKAKMQRRAEGLGWFPSSEKGEALRQELGKEDDPGDVAPAGLLSPNNAAATLKEEYGVEVEKETDDGDSETTG